MTTDSAPARDGIEQEDLVQTPVEPAAVVGSVIGAWSKMFCHGCGKQITDPNWTGHIQYGQPARLYHVSCAPPIDGSMTAPESQRPNEPNLLAQRDALREALTDMLSGWRYIRQNHGDLYGVGWDRAEDKARAALAGDTK